MAESNKMRLVVSRSHKRPRLWVPAAHKRGRSWLRADNRSRGPALASQLALDVLHQVFHHEPLLRADIHAHAPLPQALRHHGTNGSNATALQALPQSRLEATSLGNL